MVKKIVLNFSLIIILLFVFSKPCKAANVAQYDKFETALPIQAVFDNPFNPEDVKILVHFTAPSGKEIIIPAFWYQAYSAPNGSPVGSPGWRVRFTPSEIGQYSYRTEVTDRNGTRTTTSQTFESTAGSKKGFVRVSQQNPHYFSFEKDGSTFYPIGHNITWNYPDTVPIYSNYFQKMSQNGENFTRLDMGTYSDFQIEEIPQKVGTYDLKRAFNLDYVLNLADQYGIYTNMTLEWTGYLISEQPAWKVRNPYNVANGGFLTNPWEFWTNPQAKKLFKQRLYYDVARYSYSPNVLFWETMNEINVTTNYAANINDVKAWSQEMMAYLHQIDPYNHSVSQSYCMGWGDSVLNNNINLNVLQTHSYYNYKDYGQSFYQLTRAVFDNYQKPNIIGEFSLDASGPNAALADTQGIHLSTGIWGAFFGGSSASPQSWYWKDYIDQQNHYGKFKGLANFIKDVDLANLNYVPANFIVSSSLVTQRVKDLRLQGVMESWNTTTTTESLQPITVTVTKDGVINNAGLLNQRLFSTKWYFDNQKLFKNPVTFAVDYSNDSQFAVDVTEISTSASLKISLDGVVKLNQNPISVTTYTINVPKGQHQITVECEFGNWFKPDYHFYLSTLSPPLEVYGLMDTTQSNPGNLTALAWIKNENYNNYYLVTQGKTLTTVSNAILNIPGLADGNYKIEWWDTNSGTVTTQINATSRGGNLQTAIPPVTRDIAAKIYVAGSGGITPTITPSITHCVPLGDIDCSGKVNILDLSALLTAFGSTTNKQADLDDSGKVNMIDLSILLQNFGK